VSDFKILKSVNRGDDWTSVYEGDEEAGAMIQDASGRLWCVVYDDGLKYMYSTDLGTTWSEQALIDTGVITATSGILGMDYDVSGTIYLTFWADDDEVYLLTTANFFEDVEIEQIEVAE